MTHIGLAVPDIEGAIKWYEEVLDFKLIAGPYSFNVKDEKKHNMTNDLLGNHIVRMRNAHMMAGNQVGIELFEFQEPNLKNSERKLQEGYFHICLIADDIEHLAEEIVNSGGKRRSEIWNTWKGKPYYLVYCEDPYGNIIELYSHSTETMYANKDCR